MYKYESAVTDICKGQTNMLYKGEFQTLIKLSMGHHVCSITTLKEQCNCQIDRIIY